jgi:uncharacterized phage protein (TIGR01671 family)
MREIKFRAWHDGRMILVPRLFHQNENGLHHDALPAGVLMQYTGLKDKNGKEIYEGDYLTTDDGEESVLHRVVWDDDRAGFRIEYWEGDDAWDHSQLEEIDWEPRDKENRLKQYRICGNQYENPELLK